MTQDIQRLPWKQLPKQNTMDGKYKWSKSTSSIKYLVESFSLNSSDREVSRKGKGRGPDLLLCPSMQQIAETLCSSGRKVNNTDLETLTQHFDRYVDAVNLVITRIYSNPKRAQKLGKNLAEYRGHGYTLLREEPDLCYAKNEDIKELVFERMHRNVLEQAARITLTDWTRRELFNAALTLLDHSVEHLVRLLKNSYIPSDLIRQARDQCESVRNNGSGYHYSLGVLKQLRFALDILVLDRLGEKTSWRTRQRTIVRAVFKKECKNLHPIIKELKEQINTWVTRGYPFKTPQLRGRTEDFSASTENSRGQGYWFTLDPERKNEVLLFLKLPPGIDGKSHDLSPYRSRTITFRFLNWFPRAAERALLKADDSLKMGDVHRAEKLKFRGAVFKDMHMQLLNTIGLQHTRHRLSRMKQRKSVDIREVTRLEAKTHELKDSRRSAPPRLLVRGRQVTLQIPFLAPDSELISQVFGPREYCTRAGADRGIRVPVALSVQRNGAYHDCLVSANQLIDKRERLRYHARRLTSEVDRKRNNWDKKRKGLSYPTPILRKEQLIEAVWRKIRRLDREIARQVASETVWWCEKHRVKTLCFENLKNYQPPSGYRDLSWALSTNLWGRIIETVTYMRMALGHKRGGIWTGNPYLTSQKCHQCGERGLRVQDPVSTEEKRGGEFFYCPHCDTHFHADINAARNIFHVQDSSAVPGRAKDICPSLSKLQ